MGAKSKSPIWGLCETGMCPALSTVQMNAPITTECTNCRHTFLRYASSCPECGQVRLLHRKVNKPMLACLVGSAVAIGMTFTMVVKYKHSNGATESEAQRPISTR